MSDKYITKKDLEKTTNAIKDLKKTTKSIQESLTQAVEAALDGVSEMVKENRNAIQKNHQAIQENNQAIQKNHSAIRDNGRNIRDLQMDTPTQKEFDQLKTKVDRYHPVS